MKRLVIFLKQSISPEESSDDPWGETDCLKKNCCILLMKFLH